MTPLERLKNDLKDTRESLLRTASSVSRFSSIRERYYTDRANECAAQLAAVESLEQEVKQALRDLETARTLEQSSDKTANSLRIERDNMEKLKDGAYSERNRLVSFLSKMFPSSIERHVGDDWEDDWRNVIYIDLPTGQVSWHIHDSEIAIFSHLPTGAGRKWDGHTTEEKYKRLAAVEALEQENAKLREALEPFAREAGEWSTDYQKYPDSDAVVCQGFDHDGDPLKAMFTLGDLRRAAQVLAETNARKEGDA